MGSPASETQDYATVCRLLLPPKTSAPLLSPPCHPITQRPLPHHPDATAAIAALQLHPALEVLLHILNGDLASAHFYVRHMQSPPKFEGMLLHALLHRIEGDIENARAWYGDVCGSEAFEYVWRAQLRAGGGEVDDAEIQPEDVREDTKKPLEPGSDAAKSQSKTYPLVSKFLDRIAKLRSTKVKDRGSDWHAEEENLTAISEMEVRRILEWCERRFGTGPLNDASAAFTSSAEKYKAMASKQLVGGEGWRQF